MSLGSKSRSLDNYPRNIVGRVLEEFSADAVGQVHLCLEDLGSDRLKRCALFVARGSIEHLREAVSLARADERDLIVAAEYDRFLIRLRDFTRPFGSETIQNPLG
jgi:hypothetical protein